MIKLFGGRADDAPLIRWKHFLVQSDLQAGIYSILGLACVTKMFLVFDILMTHYYCEQKSI